MDKEFWHEKWKNQEIAFHQNQFHPKLIQFGSRLKKGKVLVPLCGKTLDMLWLREQGHQVLGIELSPIACEAFFEENELKYKKQKIGSEQIYFEGEGIVIICGDFFKMPLSIWENVTNVYDRAACIALPADLRKKYADEIQKHSLKSSLNIFLIAIDYESPVLIGPPFSVPHTNVLELYAAGYQVERLDRQRDETLSGRPPRFSDIEVHESVYLLKSK